MTVAHWFVITAGAVGILAVCICTLIFTFWLLFHEKEILFGMFMLGLCLVGLAYIVGRMFC